MTSMIPGKILTKKHFIKARKTRNKSGKDNVKQT
jgi:hypothetical protein